MAPRLPKDESLAKKTFWNFGFKMKKNRIFKFIEFRNGEKKK